MSYYYIAFRERGAILPRWKFRVHATPSDWRGFVKFADTSAQRKAGEYLVMDVQGAWQPVLRDDAVISNAEIMSANGYE